MLAAEDFEGAWTVVRRIEDLSGGPAGRFEGQAMFHAEGRDVLRHVEEGTLWLDSGRFAAHRVYRWQFGPGGVEVRFEDGRPFHDFRPAGLSQGSPHLCGADLYEVRYDFRDWPDWSSRWRVTGPRKDYAMETDYRRR